MNYSAKDCLYYRSLLSALLDDELARSEKNSVMTHLEDCGPCRRERAGLQAMIQEVSDLPRREVGPEFLIEVRSRLDRGEATQGALPFLKPDWFRINLVLGAALTGFIGLAVVTSDSLRDVARLPGPEMDLQIRTELPSLADASSRAALASEPGPAFGLAGKLSSDKLMAAASDEDDADPRFDQGTMAPMQDEKEEMAGSMEAEEARSPRDREAQPRVSIKFSMKRTVAPAARPSPSNREGVLADLGSHPRQESARGPAPGSAVPAMGLIARQVPDVPMQQKNRSRVDRKSVVLAARAKPSPAAPSSSSGMAELDRLARSRSAATAFADAVAQADRQRRASSAGRSVGGNGFRLASNESARSQPRGLSASPFVDAGAFFRPQVSPVLPQLPTEVKQKAQIMATRRFNEPSPPDPTLSGDPNEVHVRTLTHYLGNRVITDEAQAVYPRTEGTVLLKVTKLRPFLRGLREGADAFSVGDVYRTSLNSFEFSVQASGGRAGLQHVASRLSALPEAQASGMFFEEIRSAGGFTARVMVSLSPAESAR